MEKQTMGAFIAVLRKANGLTQKELAEKLNVSDKAVSRWERDESYPDLTLVPLIADIFGVTADELLRGERSRDDAVLKGSGTSEKRIEILINRLSAKYKNQRIISLGIAFLGLALAVIINFAVLKSYLAFGLAVLFNIAAVVLNAVFTNMTLSAVNTDEIESDEVTAFRQKTKDKSWRVYAVIALIVVFCLPLMITGGTYYGLDLMEWFYVGAAFAAVLAVLLLIIVSVVAVKGTKQLSFREKQQKNAKLKLKIIPVFIVCVAGTVIGMLLLNDYSTDIFTKGTVFETKDAFVEFMETYRYDDSGFFETASTAVPVTEPCPTEYENENSGDVSDSYGAGYEYSEVVREFVPMDYVPDDNGNILFEYPINGDVVSIEWGNGKDRMPVKVYTREDYIHGRSSVDKLTVLFILLYIAEAILPFAVYFKKKER